MMVCGVGLFFLIYSTLVLRKNNDTTTKSIISWSSSSCSIGYTMMMNVGGIWSVGFFLSSTPSLSQEIMIQQLTTKHSHHYLIVFNIFMQ
jgi:hypothetical protein